MGQCGRKLTVWSRFAGAKIGPSVSEAHGAAWQVQRLTLEATGDEPLQSIHHRLVTDQRAKNVKQVGWILHGKHWTAPAGDVGEQRTHLHIG